MNPDELPGNSNAEKREPKKIEKVIEGSVSRRKQPIGRRFAKAFFGQDAKGVVESVVTEVLVPALKDTITDAISRGIEQLLFGGPRSSSTRTSSRDGGHITHTNYRSYSSPNRNRRGEEPPSRRRNNYTSVEDIAFDTRSQAERILEEMRDTLKRYGTVSIADVVEMCGEAPDTMDDAWGWTELRRNDAYVRRMRDGAYELVLPRPEEI